MCGARAAFYTSSLATLNRPRGRFRGSTTRTVLRTDHAVGSVNRPRGRSHSGSTTSACQKTCARLPMPYSNAIFEPLCPAFPIECPFHGLSPAFVLGGAGPCGSWRLFFFVPPPPWFYPRDCVWRWGGLACLYLFTRAAGRCQPGAWARVWPPFISLGERSCLDSRGCPLCSLTGSSSPVGGPHQSV